MNKNTREEILSGLNPQQKKAVETTDGAMLILAGAGSGKTRVITHRIAYGISKGAFRPEEVLAVTFTNKAAGEMRERISALTGTDFSGLWVRTFHSACAALLRLEAAAIGRPGHFSIYDASDQKTVIKRILKKIGTVSEKVTPASIINAISRAKDNLQGPEDLIPAHEDDLFHEALKAVYIEYEKELEAARALDFGDLIFKTVRLFQEYPDTLARWQARFPYLLVDEFQDTNRAQYSLIRQLAGTRQNICVVGDDDQSIYSWRGADIRNILSFQKDFPNAEVIRLEQNYRSTPEILAIASGVIGKNSQRMGKELWSTLESGSKASCIVTEDDRAEAGAIGRAIEKLIREGTLPENIAVFYRTNSQSRTIEDELIRREIPYRLVGSVRFYERKEVKDLVAYLRLAVNGYDIQAFERAIAVPPRGAGPKTRVLIRDAVTPDTDLPAAIRLLLEDKTIKGKRAVAGLTRFVACIDAIRTADNPLAAVKAALETSSLLEHYGEEEERLDDLREFQSAVTGYIQDHPEDGLTEFLNQIALLGEADRTRDIRGIHLMTLHNAKGLEFESVFLSGMEDGLFPHFLSLEEDGKLEEERRLFYVGITRARRNLFMSAARKRLTWGRYSFNAPSPFLEEIPEGLCGFYEDDFPLEDPDREGTEQKSNPVNKNMASENAATASKDEGTTAGFQPGDRVTHPQYGGGVITRKSGVGAMAQIQVAFGEQSCLFLERYSNLTKVEEGA